MSGISRKLLGTTPAAGGQIDISEYFSTYLYTGNGSTQTITNGIDLAGEGGLVWIKSRSGAVNHVLFDTERGANNYLMSNNTNGQNFFGSYTDLLTSFNSDGFSIGADSLGNLNSSGSTYASWTFRKAPRFFDVVTYTGDGTDSRAIPHSLGIAPGFIMVKRTDSADDWVCFHRLTISNTANAWQYTLDISQTNAFYHAEGSAGKSWGGQNPDDTNFYVDDLFSLMNESGATYVAYLFAHDPLGPSGDGSDGLIACGSYAGNGGINSIDIGWEAQWVLIKSTTFAGEWTLVDVMRGMPVGSNGARLFPNTSGAESVDRVIYPNATGFTIDESADALNGSGQSYIYIAIRRGPMRQPESGTEVFNVEYQAGTDTKYRGYLGNPVDAWLLALPSNVAGKFMRSRLQGQGNYLDTTSTAAEAAQTDQWWDNNLGVGVAGTTYTPSTSTIHYLFRRAPGFFDVVAYTGDGVAGRTVPHNLGVAPEMMIVKHRNGANNWMVWASGIPITQQLVLNSTAAASVDDMFYDTLPTDSQFYVTSSNRVNGSGNTYIAYLFATLPGVSKVGSYTGNGTSQTIDCGFTSGARFVLIKSATENTDWFVFDTARGIVSGNDPALLLNVTDAEYTSHDLVDPQSSGFIVNYSGAFIGTNTSGQTYIFLAIA